MPSSLGAWGFAAVLAVVSFQEVARELLESESFVFLVWRDFYAQKANVTRELLQPCLSRPGEGRWPGAPPARAEPPRPGEYHWPGQHGRTGQCGMSAHAGPTDLNASLAWSWHHPEGKYHTQIYGLSVDDARDLYVTTDTAMWKLSPAGEALWTFTPPRRAVPSTRGRVATIFSAASILDGRVHFTTLDGRFWAVSMRTGEELWSRVVCEAINYDNGFVAAHGGVVVAASDATFKIDRESNTVVRAVNATDGSPLWAYEPEAPLWNFLASFPGDGTVLYQDFRGMAYRHRLLDGALIWKAGGRDGSWTDGGPLLAGNGVFYAVSARMEEMGLPGAMQARLVSDGSLLWEACLPLPPNNEPAFGTPAGHGRPAVVQPGGWQGTRFGPTGVQALDAETGELQWSWQGPSQAHHRQRGDAEGVEERRRAGASETYVTNPFSAAAMDAAGTVYLGHEDGLFFGLRDSDGDGFVAGPGEVFSFDTGAAFVGSSSPVVVPGLLAVANCDTVFAWRTPES